MMKFDYIHHTASIKEIRSDHSIAFALEPLPRVVADTAVDLNALLPEADPSNVPFTNAARYGHFDTHNRLINTQVVP